MNRFGFLLIALLISLSSAAKEPYYTRFNTDSFWRKLVLEPANAPLTISRSETAIIVASNREPGKDSLRFMSEVRGNGTVRFFVVYERAGQWRLHPFGSLRAAFAAIPDKDQDWLVYAEGMGKIFTTDIDRGFRVGKEYDLNILLLDYPSIRSTYKPYRNFRFVLRSSSIAYKDFTPVLDSLRTLRVSGLTGKGALSMMFHSMGNNIIRKIGQTKARQQLNGERWVDNLILNAPCVPQRRSGRWIDSLQFAKRTYVHYNPMDGTLKSSRIVSVRGILGERPVRPIAATANYVNFNTLCGPGHSNFLSFASWMIAKQEAIDHYAKLLHGGEVNLKNPNLYRPSVYRKIGWDLLPASR